MAVASNDDPLALQTLMSDAPPLVVHVIYALGTGGLENGLVNLINRSPRDRYRHAIVCLTTSGDFAARLMVPNVPIVSLHKRPGHDLGVYWRMWRSLRRLRPAIMHTRNLAALEMHLVGLFVPGLRHVHGEHGRDIYDLDGSNPRYRRLRRWIAPVVDRFITVSRDLHSWLTGSVGIAGAKVRHIYNGVDHAVFSPRGEERPRVFPVGYIDEPACVVGNVGRLAEVKDQATLLRAAQTLVQARPALRARLRVVLVGDGPLAGELERLANGLGLQDLVWFAGDRSDVPALLQAMDVFVLPSLAEGISNTVLEAMAAGLPVVATRTGGNPELVEDGLTGRLFPVGDHRALAEILIGMIDEPVAARAMGLAGRARVLERFDWQRTVDEYLAVYDQTLGVATEQ
jgi:sugar transferase (PEP-CTERM/EpsH1 system associated)